MKNNAQRKSGGKPWAEQAPQFLNGKQTVGSKMRAEAERLGAISLRLARATDTYVMVFPAIVQNYVVVCQHGSHVYVDRLHSTYMSEGPDAKNLCQHPDSFCPDCARARDEKADRL